MQKRYYDGITGVELPQQYYLYGSNKVEKIPEYVIDSRLHALNIELETHLAVHYTKRDGKRCNAIIKAIKFWDSFYERDV